MALCHLSKYNRRGEAARRAYDYLDKAIMGGSHLNATRAANFIDSVENWLDQNCPFEVTEFRSLR